MDGYRLDLSSPPDWQPLERLSELSAERPGTLILSADAFTYAGQLCCAQRPVVHLYKHDQSRAYLSIDECGHTYRVTVAHRQVAVTLCPLAAELQRILVERHPAMRAA